MSGTDTSIEMESRLVAGGGEWALTATGLPLEEMRMLQN